MQKVFLPAFPLFFLCVLVFGQSNVREATPELKRKLDKAGRLAVEEMDFNGDGVPDTFYYYENGNLVRQEVDSNFDGKIDIWVFLNKGVYVRRYERDKDFDGKPDIIKDYDRK